VLLGELAAAAADFRGRRAQRVLAQVLEHPLLTLLEEVNELLDAFSLMELTDLYLEITGKAYWWLPPGPLGTPEAIWVLPSQFVTPKWSEDKRTILRYDYGSGLSVQQMMEAVLRSAQTGREVRLA
jgi:hypothetical protein